MANDFNIEKSLPYRAPVHTRVFMGDVWLDDVVAINYQIQDFKEPVYGFKSRLFDDVTVGKTLVSGQLICHFRYPGYLTNVIEAVKKRYELPMAFKARKTPGGQPLSPLQVPSNLTTLNQELAKLGPSVLLPVAAEQQAMYWDAKPTSRTQDRPGFVQGVKDKKFDLRIVYGRLDKPTEAMFIRVVEDVLLVGEAQEISMLDGAGDMCLYEVYSFIARQVKSAV